MGNSVVLSAGQEAVVRMATCHKTLTVSIVNLAKSVQTTALALNRNCDIRTRHANTAVSFARLNASHADSQAALLAVQSKYAGLPAHQSNLPGVGMH